MFIQKEIKMKRQGFFYTEKSKEQRANYFNFLRMPIKDIINNFAAPFSNRFNSPAIESWLEESAKLLSIMLKSASNNGPHMSVRTFPKKANSLELVFPQLNSVLGGELVRLNRSHNQFILLVLDGEQEEIPDPEQKERIAYLVEKGFDDEDLDCCHIDLSSSKPLSLSEANYESLGVASYESCTMMSDNNIVSAVQLSPWQVLSSGDRTPSWLTTGSLSVQLSFGGKGAGDCVITRPHSNIPLLGITTERWHDINIDYALPFSTNFTEYALTIVDRKPPPPGLPALRSAYAIILAAYEFVGNKGRMALFDNEISRLQQDLAEKESITYDEVCFLFIEIISLLKPNRLIPDNNPQLLEELYRMLMKIIDLTLSIQQNIYYISLLEECLASDCAKKTEKKWLDTLFPNNRNGVIYDSSFEQFNSKKISIIEIIEFFVLANRKTSLQAAFTNKQQREFDRIREQLNENADIHGITSNMQTLFLNIPMNEFSALIFIKCLCYPTSLAHHCSPKLAEQMSRIDRVLEMKSLVEGYFPAASSSTKRPY